MAKQELTEMQRKFAELYVETGNATHSAIGAGYSRDTASSQGSRMLNNVKVKKYIAKLRQEEGEEWDMELELVIEELVKIIQNPKTKEHNKLEAIDKLATLKGWKKQEVKMDVTTTQTVDQMSDEELARRMAQLTDNIVDFPNKNAN